MQWYIKEKEKKKPEYEIVLVSWHIGQRCYFPSGFSIKIYNVSMPTMT